MLVRDLVEDGKRILEQLPQHGFEVTAGMWLKQGEEGLWRFYVVSPAADGEHAKEGRIRFSTLIEQMPNLVWIDPNDVRVIGLSNPIARDVLALYNRDPGPKDKPIRWNWPKLGNDRVEEVYLYPLPTAASS